MELFYQAWFWAEVIRDSLLLLGALWIAVRGDSRPARVSISSLRFMGVLTLIYKCMSIIEIARAVFKGRGG